MVKKMDFDAAPIYEKCHNEDSKLVMGSQFIESKEKPLTYCWGLKSNNTEA